MVVNNFLVLKLVITLAKGASHWQITELGLASIYKTFYYEC
jgi:hypothetical protein